MELVSLSLSFVKQNVITIIIFQGTEAYQRQCSISLVMLSPHPTVAGIQFTCNRRYLHYNSPVHHPVLPVFVELMPSAAKRLGGGESSGHPAANSLTSRKLLLHNEHSYQHPVASQTAQTDPHIPAGQRTQY
jgi:hypothetical protein